MTVTDEQRAEITGRVRDIPRDGWWHPDGEETFTDLAIDLVEAAGLTIDKAIAVLETAYGAVAGEFGS